MAVQVASLFGVLSLDDSDYNRKLGRAESAANNLGERLGRQFRDIGGTFTSAGAGLLALTAPLIGLGAVGVRTAATFETSMAEIAARTGLVGEELNRVRDFALQMGADTSFSAQQAADAFLQLLSSGSSTEEAIATLPSVLSLAAAGNLELGRTADLLTDVLKQYGLTVGSAGTVTNVLAKAAGSSSATVEDLAQGFANVGPVANMFGLSVEETAAALATLAENGIKGAEGGTALKSMLLNLSRPTDEVIGALRELGVSLYDSTGEVRGLDDIIDDLDDSLSKLPVQDQIRLSTKLAGSYGITAFNALRASGGIDEMQASMANAADAQTVADARLAGFNGAVEQLIGSLETLSIRVLTPFMQNVLTPLVQRITPVINTISEWAAANPELVTQIATLVAVVGGLGAGLVGLGLIFGAIGTAITGIGAALGLIFSPIGLIVAAVVALGAAWATNFGGIRDFVDREITPRLQAFFGWLAGVWETSIKPGLQGLWEWFTQTALPAVVGFVEGTVIPGIQKFIDILGSIWGVVSASLGELYRWFMEDALPAVVGQLEGPVGTAVQGFIDILSGLWDIVSGSLGKLYEWFVTSGLPWIMEKVSEFVETLKNIWTTVSPFITDLWEGIAEIFGNIIETVIQPLIDKVREFIDWVKQGLRELGILQSEQMNLPTTASGQNIFPETIIAANQFGFSGGGWTGDGARSDVAGVVHGQEWVIPTKGGPVIRENGGGQRQPEMMFGAGSVVIYANDAAGGRRAADGFQRRLEELRRSRGR